MMTKRMIAVASAILLAGLTNTSESFARDVEVTSSSGEIQVWISPGEPTQVRFPGKIAGGYMKENSAVSLDRREQDLVVFGKDTLDKRGEAIIVRLQDGRSYSMRVLRADESNPRDAQLTVEDTKDPIGNAQEEEDPAYVERKFDYAPPSRVSGLMREMVLATEFGKASITGYQVSEKYKGQTVLHDGTLHAQIERIFIGPNLWGYVINAENLLDQTQRLNPASFRLDGTRAISMSNWELSPRPMNVEEQVADKHTGRIYIITKAK